MIRQVRNFKSVTLVLAAMAMGACTPNSKSTSTKGDGEFAGQPRSSVLNTSRLEALAAQDQGTLLATLRTLVNPNLDLRIDGSVNDVTVRRALALMILACEQDKGKGLPIKQNLQSVVLFDSPPSQKLDDENTLALPVGEGMAPTMTDADAQMYYAEQFGDFSNLTEVSLAPGTVSDGVGYENTNTTTQPIVGTTKTVADAHRTHFPNTGIKPHLDRLREDPIQTTDDGKDGKSPTSVTINAPEKEAELDGPVPPAKGPKYKADEILVKFRNPIRSQVIKPSVQVLSVADADAKIRELQRNPSYRIAELITRPHVRPSHRIREWDPKTRKSVTNPVEPTKVKPASVNPDDRYTTTGLLRMRLEAGANPEAIAKQILKDRPDVESAEPNWIVRKDGRHAYGDPAIPGNLPNDAYYVNGAAWGLLNDLGSFAEDAWIDWSFGGAPVGPSSVYVAVVDTGIDWNHYDLDDMVSTSLAHDFVGTCTESTSSPSTTPTVTCHEDETPQDDDGHGTFVAGIIAAEPSNGAGALGINWGGEVRIVALKALDRNGEGYLSDIVNAIEYAVDAGVDVINLSLGSSSGSNSLASSIALARDYNIIVVTSAGNEAEDTDAHRHLPSNYNYPNIISVAAYDLGSVYHSGGSTIAPRASTYTNYGRCTVDLAAPGKRIVSDKARDWRQNDKATGSGLSDLDGDGEYLGYNFNGLVYQDGTSASAPFVTGVVAAIIKKFGNIDYRLIKWAILAAAVENPLNGPNGFYVKDTDGIANKLDANGDVILKSLTGGKLHMWLAIEKARMLVSPSEYFNISPAYDGTAETLPVIGPQICPNGDFELKDVTSGGNSGGGGCAVLAGEGQGMNGMLMWLVLLLPASVLFFRPRVLARIVKHKSLMVAILAIGIGSGLIGCRKKTSTTSGDGSGGPVNFKGPGDVLMLGSGAPISDKGRAINVGVELSAGSDVFLPSETLNLIKKTIYLGYQFRGMDAGECVFGSDSDSQAPDLEAFLSVATSNSAMKSQAAGWHVEHFGDSVTSALQKMAGSLVRIKTNAGDSGRGNVRFYMQAEPYAYSKQQLSFRSAILVFKAEKVGTDCKVHSYSYRAIGGDTSYKIFDWGIASKDLTSRDQLQVIFKAVAHRAGLATDGGVSGSGPTTYATYPTDVAFVGLEKGDGNVVTKIAGQESLAWASLVSQFPSKATAGPSAAYGEHIRLAGAYLINK